MINIEQAIKLAEQYGFDVNKVEKSKGGFFYINESGEKKQISTDEFTDDMKSVDFQLSNGFIVLDKIKGNIIIDKNIKLKGDLC